MIQLTTPYVVGATDPNGPYTHVKILKFGADLENMFIQFTAQMGTISGSDFIKGIRSKGTTLRTFEVINDDFDTLVAKLTSAAGVAIYDEVARELYQYLIDKGEYAGTIV